MVLARNTYRFALLFVGYGIASGIDDLGAYSAEGPALIGLGLGGLALVGGTLAHYSGGGPDGDWGPDDGGDRTADDSPEGGGGGPDGEHGADDTEGDVTDEPRSGGHLFWGRY